MSDSAQPAARFPPAPKTELAAEPNDDGSDRVPWHASPEHEGSAGAREPAVHTRVVDITEDIGVLPDERGMREEEDIRARRRHPGDGFGFCAAELVLPVS